MSHTESPIIAITGGSSGIGRETALLFAQAGARVALLARREDRLQEAAEAVRATGAAVQTHVVDVTEEGPVNRAFAEIRRTWGPIEVLINNAGVGFATDLAAVSFDQWRQIVDTNMTGAFLCTRAVLPDMKDRKRGHIVMVSSVTGKTANPNAPIYCASKFGLNGFTSGLAQQVQPAGIKVSSISPSAVDTAYWDGRPVDRSKFLSAADVARVIHFIVSQPAGVLIKDVDLAAFR